MSLSKIIAKLVSTRVNHDFIILHLIAFNFPQSTHMSFHLFSLRNMFGILLNVCSIKTTFNPFPLKNVEINENELM